MIPKLSKAAMLESLMSVPMLMTESRMAALCSLIASDQVAVNSDDSGSDAANEIRRLGSVAVVPVTGVFWQGYSDKLNQDGMLSTDVLQGIIGGLVADRGITGIVLNIDSPGGSAAGIPELASEIRAATDSKPVVAYASGLMASAAYWVGSQASMILATQSAMIGSIGAFIAVVDIRRMLDSMGVTIDMITSGPFKGMGAPGTSLTDMQRAHVQERVNEVAGQFKAVVSAARAGMVPDEAMDGRMFSAAKADALRLIDGVASPGAAIVAASRRR